MAGARGALLGTTCGYGPARPHAPGIGDLMLPLEDCVPSLVCGGVDAHAGCVSRQQAVRQGSDVAQDLEFWILD